MVSPLIALQFNDDPDIKLSLDDFVPDVCFAGPIIAQVEGFLKVRKRARIRNRYNQAQHLTQDTNGKVT